MNVDFASLTPTQTGLTAAAGVIALVYVGLVAGGVRGKPRVIKPFPALLLACVNPALAPVLVCWAAGDALLLDKDRFFLHGLGAFLVGHVAFIALVGSATGVSLPALGLGLALAITVLGRIWGGLKPKLRAPVLVYALTLIGVLAVAAAAGATGGAVLFLISDTVLAWNRFRKPLPRGDLLVMVTYYAAVFWIALACR